MFTTAASLLDLTDSGSHCLWLTNSPEKLMVALRDGRKLLGILRSWDQFANLVLQSTVERIFVPPEAVPQDHPSAATQRGLYADIQQGVFMIRGENVMLLGEIDLDKDDDAPPGYDKADPDLVKRLAKERKEADQATDKKKQKNLSALGFEGEHMGDIIL
ncbi:hypothetical protein VPNG_04699 [Cytospora leucostoma]|uniref:U6 snRNA-associated Sm-like protein LSm1 n=1 Tax=Cytospora leucostoma TaxID=1230097 RepID=A0A423XAI2_9PEZI|nr:hypothetical protein VPNG_04699 [Cytospora leucostoma]